MNRRSQNKWSYKNQLDTNMQCAVRPWADHATMGVKKKKIMQPWDFWEALRSQHVCGSTVPTRYDSYLKNSLGNLNITFLFLERFCLQETNLARPSGDVILLMLWTRRWHAGLGASHKHKDISSPGFPPLFADVTPLLHYHRWDSASGEFSSCGSVSSSFTWATDSSTGRPQGTW